MLKVKSNTSAIVRIGRLLLFPSCLLTTLFVASIRFAPATTHAQTRQQDFGLPELHRIVSITLQPTYSCRSPQDFEKGYEKTALFVSNYSRKINSPELLFEGPCHGEDYLSSPNGMDLIDDMGKVPLEEVTAQSVMTRRDIDFERTAMVKLNHTYAVLINQPFIRGLLVFTVVDHDRNERLDIRYAVKEYQVLTVEKESPGFDWAARNQ
jgi:hypothetical protein